MNQRELGEALGVGKTRVTQYKKEGMPVGDLERAKAWLAVHYPERAVQVAEADSEPAEQLADLPDLPDSEELRGKGVAVVVARCAVNENFAWTMLKERMDSKDRAGVQAVSKHYQQTVEARLQAEKELAEYRVQTGDLVQAAAAVSLLGRILSPIKTQLTALPFSCCARANPSDPALAREVLDAEVEKMKAAVSLSLEGLIEELQKEGVS